MNEPAKAPEHLSDAAQRWYVSVVADYDLEAHHRNLLRLACEAWDRTQQARELLAEHGVTYTDRFDQPRARPEVAIERDSRLAYARLVRELALDVEEPGEARPPTIVGKANRKGA